MPTFPSSPTITSRLSTGSALTYPQMDTNFGNLTASIDSVISVSRTASYVDSSNVYYTATSQSFWSASISSSTIGTATISTINVTNLTAAGTVTLNGGLTIGAGTITGNVTGSVFGTASWATQASTASYVVTAQTSSYVLNAVSSSFASTASYVLNAVSSSFASTASFVRTALTASFIPTFQQVVTRGTFASSSTNIILAATTNVQVRGEDGNSNGDATLAFGVGTNDNNYIVAGKNLIISANTGSAITTVGTVIQARTGSNYESAVVIGSGSATQARVSIQTGNGVAKHTQFEVLNELIYMYDLPTSENRVTGSLWLSGSGAGSATGSKYLMVFNG